MVLNPKDYVRASDGTGTAVRAVVASKREPNDLYLNVDSVAHWPNKFIATAGTIDESTGMLDPDTFTEFYGHLEGSIIVIEEFCPGYSDYGNEPYDIVVIKPATAWADAVAEVAEAGIPAGGTTGQALVKKSDDDGDVEWGSGGGVSIISKETPSGTKNGTNKVFTTSLPYVGGSLQVYVNGIAQSSFVTETSPTTNTFTLDVAPESTDDLSVAYQFSPSETGNADTLDGYHANATPMANNIPVLDSNGKLPNTALDINSMPGKLLAVSNLGNFDNTYPNETYISNSNMSITLPPGATSIIIYVHLSMNINADSQCIVRMRNGLNGSGGQLTRRVPAAGSRAWSDANMTHVLTGLTPGGTYNFSLTVQNSVNNTAIKSDSFATNQIFAVLG